jgi:histone-lysine N-methyltransferase MLL3
VDKWIHLNCALWSEEVYETENGALVNVDLAVKQSLNITCTICKQDGASVKCFKVRCISVYHVGCAVKEGCAFYKNKVIRFLHFILVIYLKLLIFRVSTVLLIFKKGKKKMN